MCCFKSTNTVAMIKIVNYIVTYASMSRISLHKTKGEARDRVLITINDIL